ncbi:MAG: type III pantothenate kinase [Desulfovibrionaceae bacterium]
MSLLIDIGNTVVKFSVGDEEKRGKTYHLSTCILHEEPLDAFFLQIIEESKLSGKIRNAIISSVVPECMPFISMACKRVGIKDVYATKDIAVPIKLAFTVPAMLGVDRIILAYAANLLYPQQSIIVVSYGTATTFNCIEKGIFLGGAIAPGLVQSLRGLVANAALLSDVPIGKCSLNQPIIAQQTTESVQSGFTQGFAAMTEGLIQKMSAELAQKPIVIAAGGMAEIVSSYTDCFTLVYEDLVLEGLYRLYKTM